MSRLTVNINTDATERPGLGAPTKFEVLANLEAILRRIKTGQEPAVVGLGGLPAAAVVTPTGVQGADTVTVNGTALTATQHNSSGTVTVVVANTDVDDTVTIGGLAFTAKAAENLAARQFNIGGTDTVAGTSLKDCINFQSTLFGSTLYNLVTATSAAGVVTVRAVAAGTGGDAITLASSDADGLAVSGANLAGGAAVANNQFDFKGSDIETATALAAALIASSTALVGSAVVATNYAATITLATAAVGCTIDIGGVKMTGMSGTGAGLSEGAFTVGSTDTNDATSLKNAINAHNKLKDLYLASSSAGVVTLRPYPNRSGAVTGIIPTLVATGSGVTVAGFARVAGVFVVSRELGLSGNQATIASSNGTRLPIEGSATRLAGGTVTSVTF